MTLTNTKLAQTIAALKPYEQQRIKDFIESSIFFDSHQAGESRTKLLLLYDTICNIFLLPTPEAQAAVTKEWVFEQVFQKTTFQPAEYNRLASVLLKVIKKTLVFWHFDVESELLGDTSTKEILQEVALISFYRNRGEVKNLSVAVKNLRKNNPMNKWQGIEALTYSFLGEWLVFEQNIQVLSADWDTQYHLTSDRLDELYFWSKLHLLSQNPHQLNQNLPDLERLVVALRNKNYELVLAVFKTLSQMFVIETKQADESVNINLLNSFETVFAQAAPFIPLSMKRDICTHARNYCRHQYDLGRYGFGKRLFDLLQHHLEQGLLFHTIGNNNKCLLPTTFINYVKVAINENAIDEALIFIENHKKRLTGVEDNDKKRLVALYLAECYLAKGQLQTALDQFDEGVLGFKQWFFELIARSLEVKICFELNSQTPSDELMERLEKRLDAFSTYLNEHKKEIPTIKVRGYRHFKNGVVLMLKITSETKLFRKKLSQTQLETLSNSCNHPHLAEKQWLQKQQELLINRKER